MPAANRMARTIAMMCPDGLLSIAALFIGLTALPSIASAETETYDLGGRWTSDRLHYVLDIAKCGEEWCGVRVGGDESCGAVALRLRWDGEEKAPIRFIGHLDLQPEIKPYEVSVTLDPAGSAKPTRIEMLGDTDEAPSFMTRTIPFYESLVRGGDAKCKTEPKTS